MATITKSGKKWRAQICVNGQRESKSFEMKSEAKDWAARREIELSETKGTARITFRELANAWIDRYPNRQHIQWETTRLAYLLQDWLGETRLDKLTKVEIAKWRDERLETVSPGTVLRDWNLLSSVCGDAVQEMGMLTANPFNGVKRPEEPESRDRIPTAKELETLEFFATTRPSGSMALRMFKFAIQTGMSAGEICAITYEQVDFDKRVASLPPFKKRPAREVPLSKAAMELLGKGVGKVFPMSARQLDTNWRNLCEAAAVEDLHFHDSRHAAATWLSKKIEAVALAKMLGHRNLKMLLNVYYKADASSLVAQLD